MSGGMADSLDPVPSVWSGSALFAYAILSEKFVYQDLVQLP